MATRMTINGVSTCTEAGTEKYERFQSGIGRRKRTLVQYDYRHTDGELFTCVKPTLDECRTARNKWLKFAVAVISSLFLIFLFFMRIQELRELSFKLSYLPLVYPTFFLCVFLSHRSFSFRVLEKVGIRECKVFRGNTTRRAGDFRRKQEA